MNAALAQVLTFMVREFQDVSPIELSASLSALGSWQASTGFFDALPGVPAMPNGALDGVALATAYRMCRFALSCYGYLGNSFLQLSDPRGSVGLHTLGGVLRSLLAGDEDGAFAELAGIAREDILVSSPPAAVGLPRHWLVADDSTRSLVIACRGTLSVQDVVTDALAHSAPFCGGVAHEGIAHGARAIFTSLAPRIREELERRNASALPGEEWGVVVTGHSLGGGTAMLLTILCAWEQAAAKKAGRPPPFGSSVTCPDCYAFAPPPVFAPVSSLPQHVSDRIAAWVHGADAIPRLSLSSLRQLLGACTAIAKAHPSLRARLLEPLDLGPLLAQLEEERKGLLPAGAPGGNPASSAAAGGGGRADASVSSAGMGAPPGGPFASPASAPDVTHRAAAVQHEIRHGHPPPHRVPYHCREGGEEGGAARRARTPDPAPTPASEPPREPPALPFIDSISRSLLGPRGMLSLQGGGGKDDRVEPEHAGEESAKTAGRAEAVAAEDAVAAPSSLASRDPDQGAPLAIPGTIFCFRSPLDELPLQEGLRDPTRGLPHPLGEGAAGGVGAGSASPLALFSASGTVAAMRGAAETVRGLFSWATAGIKRTVELTLQPPPTDHPGHAASGEAAGREVTAPPAPSSPHPPPTGEESPASAGQLLEDSASLAPGVHAEAVRRAGRETAPYVTRCASDDLRGGIPVTQKAWQAHLPDRYLFALRQLAEVAQEQADRRRAAASTLGAGKAPPSIGGEGGAAAE